MLGSAHNLKEIKIKQRQKVKKIFISSLFKRNKNYLVKITVYQKMDV